MLLLKLDMVDLPIQQRLESSYLYQRSTKTTKHPKPTRANPRGTSKASVNSANDISMVPFMDNGACYFIDTVYGPHKFEWMNRNVGRRVESYLVPKCIPEYNKFGLHGVDIVDQDRTGFYSLDTNRCTKNGL